MSGLGCRVARERTGCAAARRIPTLGERAEEWLASFMAGPPLSCGLK